MNYLERSLSTLYLWPGMNSLTHFAISITVQVLKLHSQIFSLIRYYYSNSYPPQILSLDILHSSVLTQILPQTNPLFFLTSGLSNYFFYHSTGCPWSACCDHPAPQLPKPAASPPHGIPPSSPLDLSISVINSPLLYPWKLLPATVFG